MAKRDYGDHASNDNLSPYQFHHITAILQCCMLIHPTYFTLFLPILEQCIETSGPRFLYPLVFLHQTEVAAFGGHSSLSIGIHAAVICKLHFDALFSAIRLHIQQSNLLSEPRMIRQSLRVDPSTLTRPPRKEQP